MGGCQSSQSQALITQSTSTYSFHPANSDHSHSIFHHVPRSVHNRSSANNKAQKPQALITSLRMSSASLRNPERPGPYPKTGGLNGFDSSIPGFANKNRPPPASLNNCNSRISVAVQPSCYSLSTIKSMSDSQSKNSLSDSASLCGVTKSKDSMDYLEERCREEQELTEGTLDIVNNNAKLAGNDKSQETATQSYCVANFEKSSTADLVSVVETTSESLTIVATAAGNRTVSSSLATLANMPATASTLSTSISRLDNMKGKFSTKRFFSRSQPHVLGGGDATAASGSGSGIPTGNTDPQHPQPTKDDMGSQPCWPENLRSSTSDASLTSSASVPGKSFSRFGQFFKSGRRKKDSISGSKFSLPVPGSRNRTNSENLSDRSDSALDGRSNGNVATGRELKCKSASVDHSCLSDNAQRLQKGDSGSFMSSAKQQSFSVSGLSSGASSKKTKQQQERSSATDTTASVKPVKTSSSEQQVVAGSKIKPPSATTYGIRQGSKITRFSKQIQGSISAPNSLRLAPLVRLELNVAESPAVEFPPVPGGVSSGNIVETSRKPNESQTASGNEFDAAIGQIRCALNQVGGMAALTKEQELRDIGGTNYNKVSANNNANSKKDQALLNNESNNKNNEKDHSKNTVDAAKCAQLLGQMKQVTPYGEARLNASTHSRYEYQQRLIYSKSKSQDDGSSTTSKDTSTSARVNHSAADRKSPALRQESFTLLPVIAENSPAKSSVQSEGTCNFSSKAASPAETTSTNSDIMENAPQASVDRTSAKKGLIDDEISDQPDLLISAQIRPRQPSLAEPEAHSARDLETRSRTSSTTTIGTSESIPARSTTSSSRTLTQMDLDAGRSDRSFTAALANRSMTGSYTESIQSSVDDDDLMLDYDLESSERSHSNSFAGEDSIGPIRRREYGKRRTASMKSFGGSLQRNSLCSVKDELEDLLAAQSPTSDGDNLFTTLDLLGGIQSGLPVGVNSNGSVPRTSGCSTASSDGSSTSERPPRPMLRPPLSASAAADLLSLSSLSCGGRMNSHVYNNLQQDVTVVKTLLLRLKRVLQEAETVNPFENVLSPTKSGVVCSRAVVDGVSVSSQPSTVEELQTENQELRQRVAVLESMLEERDKTIRILQQQIENQRRRSLTVSSLDDSSNTIDSISTKPLLSSTARCEGMNGSVKSKRAETAI